MAAWQELWRLRDAAHLRPLQRGKGGSSWKKLTRCQRRSASWGTQQREERWRVNKGRKWEYPAYIRYSLNNSDQTDTHLISDLMLSILPIVADLILRTFSVQFLGILPRGQKMKPGLRTSGKLSNVTQPGSGSTGTKADIWAPKPVPLTLVCPASPNREMGSPGLSRES